MTKHRDVRRMLIKAAAGGPLLSAASSLSAAAALVGPKPSIDRRIAALAREIAGARPTPDAARRLHDWVRDEIRFGLTPAFYAQSPLEVLESGVGYCNTKATLFIALLRSVGFDARLRMYDLSSSVLAGLFDTGGDYVDHGITEVSIDGRWIGVDSYVVDRLLAESARRRLGDRTAGFGIHRNGTSDWSGREPAFIQAVPGPTPPNYILRDHGVFANVEDFYAKTPSARNRRGLALRIGLALTAASTNRRIEEVRSEAAQ